MSEAWRPTELAASPSLDFAKVYSQAFTVLTVVELAYFLQTCRGKTQNEIADDYGVSRQTVNDAYKRSLKKLK